MLWGASGWDLGERIVEVREVGNGMWDWLLLYSCLRGECV